MKPCLLDTDILFNIALSNSSTEEREKLPPKFWREKRKAMLERQRSITSNFLLHDDQDCQFNREQIYVPLALVERRKPDKKDREHSPEARIK